MSALVLKNNAYVVTGTSRSYKCWPIRWRFELYKHKKPYVGDPFTKYIHHVLVDSQDSVRIVGDTNKKMKQPFSAQISPTRIHIANVKADPNYEKIKSWVILFNGKPNRRKTKNKAKPRAGFEFLEEGYAVKHVHLIERGGNYGDVYGWWQNDELGSFYLYTDGSVDDTKLNVKSPILFVVGDAIEYWKDAVGYTFVRSSTCSIM
jgi:hypothetical protein